ncbi:MAG: PDGLE domain-containing protein [Nitrospirae bacterium]|nr:PDGLE domain-containing protein [Nitrospirota bacterium]
MKGSRLKKLWIGIGLLILLSPLGLILPKVFKAGSAWGEWSAEEIEKIVGYIPKGIKKFSDIWKSPIPDYSFSEWDSGIKSYIGYIISGIIGVLLVVGVSILIGKILARKNGNT